MKQSNNNESSSNTDVARTFIHSLKKQDGASSELNNIIDRLIKTSTDYQEFLQLQITEVDRFFLESDLCAAQLVSLGHRGLCEKISKQDYINRKATMVHKVKEDKSSWNETLESAGIDCSRSKFLHELQWREKLVKEGRLSTIIFVRKKTKSSEISAFIDYGARLAHESWSEIFKGKQVLEPNRDIDLSYFEWDKMEICYNCTANFSCSMEDANGIRFTHKKERITLICDPNPDVIKYDGDSNIRVAKRTNIFNDPNFEQITIYDWSTRDIGDINESKHKNLIHRYEHNYNYDYEIMSINNHLKGQKPKAHTAPRSKSSTNYQRSTDSNKKLHRSKSGKNM